MQFKRVFQDGSEGWGEYWLSPAQGNFPVYITSGLKVRDSEKTAVVMSQHIQWRQYDEIWFPERIERTFRSEGRRADNEMVVTRSAKFNAPTFPDAFDPTTLGLDPSTAQKESKAAKTTEE